MSFDGTVELKALDAITVIACLGNYPLDATVCSVTRLGFQRLDGSWSRNYMQSTMPHTFCLRCLCKSMTRITGSDGRKELMDAVVDGWIAIHSFAPKGDLFQCGCRILPNTRPKGEGTWKKRTHQF